MPNIIIKLIYLYNIYSLEQFWFWFILIFIHFEILIHARQMCNQVNQVFFLLSKLDCPDSFCANAKSSFSLVHASDAIFTIFLRMLCELTQFSQKMVAKIESHKIYTVLLRDNLTLRIPNAFGMSSEDCRLGWFFPTLADGQTFSTWLYLSLLHGPLIVYSLLNEIKRERINTMNRPSFFVCDFPPMYLFQNYLNCHVQSLSFK